MPSFPQVVLVRRTRSGPNRLISTVPAALNRVYTWFPLGIDHFINLSNSTQFRQNPPFATRPPGFDVPGLPLGIGAH